MKAQWLNRSLLVGPYLTLCTTEEMFRRVLTEDLEFTEPLPFHGSQYANATTHHLENKDGEAVAIVCISGYRGRDPIAVAGLLVHEAVHVWQEHCKRIGESAPGREAEAYAIQWISQELLWEFVRQTSVQGEPITQ